MVYPHRALIIDDESVIRESCSRLLSKEGLEVTVAEGGDTALRLLDKWAYDLILLDLVIPGYEGLELLRHIRAQDQEAIVLVISGYGTVQSAVEAMKLGAYDFLAKPFTPADLRKMVRQAMEKRRLALENLYLRQELEHRRHRTQIVSRSRAMSQVIEIVERVAPTDTTVLLTGESGTGKSLIARRIHELSARSDRPFVNVDCGTLVETLFESELFGHVKGAFTGADTSKIGKFELSHNGTIFFDEISNISLDVQAKLLKAVDDRVISKVGSHRTINVNVRILAATNQNLQQAISDGHFREDLYYRLNVVSIHIPPLRERREDVPTLIDFFMKLYNGLRNMKVESISPRAMQILLEYDWPGNVRELANMVERLVVLGREGIIQHDDLAFVGWQKTENLVSGHAAGLSLQEAEREHILKVLNMYEGRRGETAEALGIDRKTLREKIKRYGLE
ncbi:MAG: sigma-54 dependent transcriptional regulator [Proteobacteria bacterium]|nr:sigma-54 dependent transcriptional regulator [Pseudomonadota bacterium]